MKRSAIVLAVGAAALLGGSAANAADNTVKAKAATDVSQQSTDFSSRGRHYRQYGYRSYRPSYRNSYGYGPHPERGDLPAPGRTPATSNQIDVVTYDAVIRTLAKPKGEPFRGIGRRFP